jgi:hypothetical protein
MSVAHATDAAAVGPRLTLLELPSECLSMIAKVRKNVARHTRPKPLRSFSAALYAPSVCAKHARKLGRPFPHHHPSSTSFTPTFPSTNCTSWTSANYLFSGADGSSDSPL